MAFRVHIDGITIECDTAGEAIGLIDHYAQKPKRSRSSKKPEKAVSLTPDYSRFWETLDDRAQRTLSVLIESKEPLPTELLAKKSGNPLDSLKYRMRSIRANAQAHHIHNDIVTRERDVVNGKPTSVYSLTEEARTQLAELM